jgi:hypothetical protein
MKKILNILIVVFILAVSILPVFINTENVYADTANLIVNGYGHTTGSYSFVGGAWNVFNSDDDNTSYLRQFGLNALCTVNFVDFSETNDGINSVTLYFKSLANGYVSVTPVCYISGTIYYGTPKNLNLSYATYLQLWTTNPATGTAWTNSTLSSAEFGLYYNYYLYAVKTTYMYISIDYNSLAPLTVSSVAADNITYTGAVHWADLNGTIDNLGGFASCADRGFVWDTSSHNLVSENVTPAASGYANSFTDTGTFITGAFDNTIGGLVAGTTYYYRAFAKNTLGYDYGSELTFETLYTPSISISPATAISTTTAQINAIVADDGNQSCDVRFGYGITTQAAVAAYDNQTAWITDVYDIGESAYAELSALNPATTYYFRAEIKNDVGSSESNELNFTTVNAVNEPVSIIAIPYGTSLSLTWVKGSGAPYTLIRYSTGSYPATTSSGTLAYLGTGESVMVEDLTPGITYYISAWGKEAATYSTGYETALATTLAYDTGINQIDNIETPPDNDDFLLTPSETNVSNIPLVSGLVKGVSNSYGTPVNMVWYVGWVIVGIGIFVVVYNKFGFKLLMTLVCEIMWFAIGSTLGLTMLWIVVILLIVSAGFMTFGERR